MIASKPSMILDRHPDAQAYGPQPGLPGTFKFIGYWAGSSMPLRLGVQVRPEIALPNPSDYVDELWDLTEWETVVAHLTAGTPWEQWRGESWCRFACGERQMGSTDRTDGTYVWPEGFQHYIEFHDVRPTQEFIDHCMAARPV